MQKVKFLYTKNEIEDTSSFIHNFDVSVIMPFYKKMKEFRMVFPRNYFFFQRNGIEVVICMDEDSEEGELLEFIKQYPFINWKIIVNHRKHDWRNPSKALNVGIRHAIKKYVFVCSPESQFVSDIIYLMRRALFYYPDHFTIGLVDFKNYSDGEKGLLSRPYGSIMGERKDFIAIRGYNEHLSKWGR